jgi:hypothetical protein
MAKIPNHTITIGNMGFYASKCKSSQPQKKAVNYDLVTIERGLPRAYPVDTPSRVITFSVILQVGVDGDSMLDINSKLDDVIGIQTVTSIYLGKMNAYVVVSDDDWADAQPDAMTVNFTVTEVASDG